MLNFNKRLDVDVVHLYDTVSGNMISSNVADLRPFSVDEFIVSPCRSRLPSHFCRLLDCVAESFVWISPMLF